MATSGGPLSCANQSGDQKGQRQDTYLIPGSEIFNVRPNTSLL